MAGPNFQPSDGIPTIISILLQLVDEQEYVPEMYMIHLVSYWISVGRNIQILTDTLMVMSMGI